LTASWPAWSACTAATTDGVKRNAVDGTTAGSTEMSSMSVTDSSAASCSATRFSESASLATHTESRGDFVGERKDQGRTRQVGPKHVDQRSRPCRYCVHEELFHDSGGTRYTAGIGARGDSERVLPSRPFAFAQLDNLPAVESTLYRSSSDTSGGTVSDVE
jgi:hypothetical protein